jgi:hypothetical protein
VAKLSAILAVEEIAHRSPPGLGHFGVHLFARYALDLLRFAAGRTTVRETGLIRFQNEFLVANDAGSNRERHNSTIVIEAMQLL